MTTSVSQPWASFCLATYRRPERLQKTLESIIGQTFTDLEIVVTDNDPERSAESIVEQLADTRVSYRANETNLGMVGNFNRALQSARGEYVVMITDDDPVYPHMLSTLYRLWSDDPRFGAYFGACEVDFQDELVAAKYGRSLGKVRWLAERPEHAVWNLEASHFPSEYFRGRVFPYVLWSCGVVRRDIALEIGGMPDYGSPFLTDFGYIGLAGSRAGCRCVNTAVGFQAVHSGNFGRQQTLQLVGAVQGFHSYVEQRMQARPTWPAERQAMESMLGRWFFDHVIFLWHFHRSAAERRLILITLARSIRVPYLRKMFGALAMRTIRLQTRSRVRGM